MAAKKTSLKRVLWSADAFEEKSDMRNHAVGALKYLLHRLPKLKIEPAYVLSPAELDLSLDFSPPWIKQFRPGAEKALARSAEASGLTTALPPKILVQRSPSLASSIQTLLKYAKSVKTDLIVTGTHARQGVGRWVLGSFAETLVAQSRIPLLIVGPESQALHRGHILFATDLGPNSATVFKRVLSLAQDLDAKITVLHVMPRPVAAVIQSGIYMLGGGWVPVQDFLGSEETSRTKRVDKWIQEAKKKGVSVEFVLERTMGGKEATVAQTILAQAQSRQAGIIAIAAQSSAVSAAVLGSTARQVIRQAPCPVWVWRP